MTAMQEMFSLISFQLKEVFTWSLKQIYGLKLALSIQIETQQGCVFLLHHRKLATRCEHGTSADSRGLKKDHINLIYYWS